MLDVSLLICLNPFGTGNVPVTTLHATSEHWHGKSSSLGFLSRTTILPHRYHRVSFFLYKLIRKNEAGALPHSGKEGETP